MSQSLLESQQDIINMLKEGLFVEGMEKYYADDVVNIEPVGEPRSGKAAIIANEKEILGQVAAFHGIEVRSLGVGEDDGKGNGVTYAEYKISVDMKDGSKFNPDQVQITRWAGGKAIEIKFYYNPDFGA